MKEKEVETHYEETQNYEKNICCLFCIDTIFYWIYCAVKKENTSSRRRTGLYWVKLSQQAEI